MEKFFVHPDRKREVWQIHKRKYVIYWDLTDEHGLMWPLSHDRTCEPDTITYFHLLENGWKKIS